MAKDQSKKLSAKQELFISEYFKDLNASQACIRAGYSSKAMASYLMALPKIKEKIEQIREQIKTTNLVTVEYILQGLTEVVDRCLQKKPYMIWDDIKHCRTQAKNEDGNLVWMFDSNGANKALELLGRYIGLFNRDNYQRVNPVNNKAELTTEQFNKLLDAAMKGSEIAY